MRTAFVETLTRLASEDPRVQLVVGDLGFSVVEPFAEGCPSQFLNAGVCEQAMTGLAAGLASTGGRVVFTYSIANFPTLRCLEQIRNDVCGHDANVKVVAVGGGVAYGAQGYTHFAVEDLGVIRALPGIVVCAPADPAEAEAAARLAVSTPGPWYIRLGKAGEPSLHEGPLEGFAVGRALHLTEGSEAMVFALGSIAVEAWAAVRSLREAGHDVGFATMPFLHPLDSDAVLRASRSAPLVVTVEEHGPRGGLGSAVAEVLAEDRGLARLRRLHLPERVSQIGSQGWLRRRCGLDAEGIRARLEGFIGEDA
jgi:transketolase